MSEPIINRTRRKYGLWQMWKLALQVGDDENASRLNVLEKTMRIGETIVRFGGIAGVGTRPEYRLKGYASRVMDASTELMIERGYDMGVLFGIGNFYHRFGYAVVFPIPRLHLKTEALLSAAAPLKTRAMKARDAGAVRRLYNRLNLDRVASVVRPGAWSYFEMSQGFEKPGRAIVVEDARGRIQGYATWQVQDEQFLVPEVSGTGSEAFASLGRALGQRARTAKMGQVIFDLPRDDAFVDFCAPLGCEHRVTYPHNSDAMARIIHLKPLMKKLVPEFSKRSAGFGGRVSVSIETDIGTVGLGIDRNGVRLIRRHGVLAVKMPQLILTQLVMGYRSASDIAAEPGVVVPKNTISVLDLLFPKRDGYMWWSDRF